MVGIDEGRLGVGVCVCGSAVVGDVHAIDAAGVVADIGVSGSSFSHAPGVSARAIDNRPGCAIGSVFEIAKEAIPNLRVHIRGRPADCGQQSHKE